jgi:lipopolysaccharide biosynthesis glycosyltransferase
MMIGRKSYLLRLAVAGRSMIDNLGADQSLVIRIVEDGISDRSKERLMHSWDLERTKVEWLPVDLGGRIELPTVPGLSPIYLARLFAPSYVPEDWYRVIFLDPDVLSASAIRMYSTLSSTTGGATSTHAGRSTPGFYRGPAWRPAISTRPLSRR